MSPLNETNGTDKSGSFSYNISYKNSQKAQNYVCIKLYKHNS